MPLSHSGNWETAATAVDEAGAPLRIHGGGRYDIPHEETVAGITSRRGQFSTFSATSVAAGLSDTLAADGAFTVLVPTDQAFERLPAGLLDWLMRPDQLERLRSVLLYHLSPGVIDSTQFRRINQLPTPHGLPVPVRMHGERALLGDATLVQPDIVAANGIIHAIDTVLEPPRRGPHMHASSTGEQRSGDARVTARRARHGT